MRTVLPPAADKPRFVASLFGRIAGRYDLMNTLMTAGMDRSWRRAVAALLPRASTAWVLDVGTGTGKLARAVAERLGGSAHVVGVDFSEPMLRIARAELTARRGARTCTLAAADGLRLPFADGGFDAVVSAFVVRNLADVQAGLREQARVLRPGGRLVALETTPGPEHPLLGALFRAYFRGLVPVLGQLIAGDAAAYAYLPESSAAFLTPERLAETLRSLGLTDVTTRRLALGGVAITMARKPGPRTED